MNDKPVRFLRTINRLFLREYQREWLMLFYGSARGYRDWWDRSYRPGSL